MSVPVGVARVRYIGSGSAGPFAFNFVLYDAEHITVVKTSTSGVDTTLELTTDYSVVLATDFSSATVTLVTPLAGDGIDDGGSEILTITRDPPIQQLIQWPRNDPFPSVTHERAADLAVMMIGRLNEKIGRSLLLPESSNISGLTLPTPDALKFLRWNAAADALENMGIADAGLLIVSPFVEGLLDDANAAAFLTGLGVSAFAQTLLDDADAATARATLSSAARATRQTIAFGAGSLTPREVSGSTPAELTVYASPSNGAVFSVMDFDQTTREDACFMIPMPKSWDRGTLTFQAIWTASAGTAAQTVRWSLGGFAAGDDDPTSGTYGGDQFVDDALIALDDVHITAISPAITVNGSPAEGDALFMRLYRDVANDNLAGDARLIGIRVHYNTTTETDA